MKGICFKEPLFHATIEGRKTQTRRIMEPQPQGCFVPTEKGYQDGHYTNFNPRYKPGEVVYLKEPYAILCGAEHLGVLYKFRGDRLLSAADSWSNKLFMPADDARYFIRITAVRAERLQEISYDDCIREGIRPFDPDGKRSGFNWGAESKDIQYLTPREAYKSLIDKINGRGTWDSNPRVWVYDYELHRI